LLLAVASLAIQYFLTSSVWVYFYYRNIFAADEWVTYYSLINEDLTRALFSRRNGHANVIPSALQILDIRLFSAGTGSLVAYGFLARCSSIAIIAWCLATEHISRGSIKIVLICLSITLYFWLGNAVQMGVGYNSPQVYSVALFTMASSIATYQTSKSRGNRFIWLSIAMFFAFLSTFSFGIGVAAWGIILFFGFILKLRKMELLFILIATFITGLIYLNLPSNDSAVHSITIHLPSILRYIYFSLGSYVRYLFSPFLGQPDAWAKDGDLIASTASLIGLLAMTITLLHYIRSREVKSRLEVVFLTLTLVGFSSIFLIPFGRVMFLQPLAPRYLIWSTLFWLGLLSLLIYKTHLHNKFSSACITTIAVILISTPIFSHMYYADWLKRASDSMKISALPFKIGIISRTDKEAMKPWPKKLGAESVDKLYPFLEAKRLNFYADGDYDLLGHKLAGTYNSINDLGGNGCTNLEISSVTFERIDVANITGNTAGIEREALAPRLAARIIRKNRTDPPYFGKSLVVTDSTDRIVGFGWMPGRNLTLGWGDLRFKGEIKAGVLVSINIRGESVYHVFMREGGGSLCKIGEIELLHGQHFKS
jgi:hypothetical protein